MSVALAEDLIVETFVSKPKFKTGPSLPTTSNAILEGQQEWPTAQDQKPRAHAPQTVQVFTALVLARVVTCSPTHLRAQDEIFCRGFTAAHALNKQAPL